MSILGDVNSKGDICFVGTVPYEFMCTEKIKANRDVRSIHC
jgi:hypothetical protein